MNPVSWRLRFRVPLALLSGALLLLAFPPVDQRFAAFAALVPFALALRGATGRAGFLIGLVAGLAFFLGALSWLLPFGVLAWAVTSVAMALSWALVGWFGAWSSRNLIGRLLGMPIVFVAFEIVRSRVPLGGFAWALAGTTQHSGGPLLPLARVGGVWLISLVLVIINVGIAEVLARGRVWLRSATATLVAAAAVAPMAIPVGIAGGEQGTIDIAAVQVNVREGTFGPQRGRRLGPEDAEILDAFVRSSLSLASDPPDLVVWPENAVDRDPLTDPTVGGAIVGAVKAVGSPFLLGAILDDTPTTFKNSLLLYDRTGEVTRRYDKQHLVPFGEYVPFPSLRKVLPVLDQVPLDGVPGTGPVVFDVNGAKIGGVICFESIFPDLVRDFVNDGASMLVVATNNASFGRSVVAREHIAMSQIRAVEQGRWIVHAAISGISGIVSPKGKISQRTEVFSDALLRAKIPLAGGRTPFAKYGGIEEAGFASSALIIIAFGAMGVIARRRDKREGRAADEFEWGSDVHRLAPDAAAGNQARPTVEPTAENVTDAEAVVSQDADTSTEDAP